MSDTRFLNFNPTYIRTFMGGDFNLGRPTTVGELREALKELDQELAGWGGDDVKISELAIVKDKIHITLVEGVAE